jgi:hypothetical protein
MSDELKEKLAEMQKQLDKQQQENAEIQAKLQQSLEAKADIVKSRDELKKQINDQKTKNATDNASTEELKKLLVDAQKENEKLRNDRQNDSKLSQLEKAAKAAGFVTDANDNVNMKLLQSQIDIEQLPTDDDGNLYGAEQKLAKLKESDPYFFQKKKAPGQDPKIDPKSVKGEDLSPEAIAKMPFAEQVAAMKKVGEKNAKAEKENGLPPGMRGRLGNEAKHISIDYDHDEGGGE